MSTRTRTRLKPALSMNHLADMSGGTVVDVMKPVTAFTAHHDNLASPIAARHAFAKVFDGVCEIIAKTNPEIALPKSLDGEIKELGEIISHEVGMPITEANANRVRLNGYLASAAFLVNKFAVAKGIDVPYRSDLVGDHFISGGELTPLAVEHEKPSIPGLTKSEMDAALHRWADCLATLAAVVNAAPTPTETPTVSDEPEAPADPEEPAQSE